MRGKKITAAVISLLAFSLCPAAEATVATDLQSAVKLYSAQNYNSAIMQLALVLSKDPSNAEAHYFLGCCYMGKRQMRESYREFQTALRLDANGAVGSMSRAALKSLSSTSAIAARASAQSSATKTASQPSVPASATSPASTAAKAATAVSPKTGSTIAGAKPVPDTIDGAIALLKNQIGSEKQRHQSLGQIRADDQITNANVQVEELKKEKELTLNNMRLTAIGSKQGIASPQYTEAQIKSVSDNYDVRINLILQQGKARADKERQFSAARASDMDRIVDALSTQMNSQHGVKLLPKGTNLYVRNYGDGPSSPAMSSSAEERRTSIPEQLAADQDRLILTPATVPGKMVSHVVPAPFAASQDKLHLKKSGADSGSTSLDVHGRITHM